MTPGMDVGTDTDTDTDTGTDTDTDTDADRGSGARADAEGTPARCRSRTKGGRPCRRRAVRLGCCRQHAGPAFYARALAPAERESYEEALAQEGLAGEVAVLRLHLSRLIAHDDADGRAEIPRTVHALVRALRDSQAAGAGGAAGIEGADPLALLDAAVRDEGLRLLDAASMAHDDQK